MPTLNNKKNQYLTLSFLLIISILFIISIHCAQPFNFMLSTQSSISCLDSEKKGVLMIADGNCHLYNMPRYYYRLTIINNIAFMNYECQFNCSDSNCFQIYNFTLLPDNKGRLKACKAVLPTYYYSLNSMWGIQYTPYSDSSCNNVSGTDYGFGESYCYGYSSYTAYRCEAGGKMFKRNCNENTCGNAGCVDTDQWRVYN